MSRRCEVLDKSIISSGFLDSIDYVFSDCDGVLWMEDKVIPGSPEAINALVEKGKHVIYITNNSTKDRSTYLQKLHRMGFPAELDDIFPTSYCAAIYLQSLGFKKKVFVFGGSGLVTELNRVGIETTPCGPDPLPENFAAYVQELKLDPEIGAVIVGFDEHVSYPKLLKAASYLKNADCLFLSANKDIEYLLRDDLLAPGTGTFVVAIETISRRMSTVLGKPNKFMIDCIKQKFPNIVNERCLMIGDNLNSDILLGTQNQLKTLLVLTGVSSLEEVRAHEKSSNTEDQLHIPDFYLSRLGDLAELLKE